MDKLDKESILKNAKISDKQTRKFAYGITAEMIITYVNEYQKEYEKCLKQERNRSYNKSKRSGTINRFYLYICSVFI